MLMYIARSCFVAGVTDKIYNEVVAACKSLNMGAGIKQLHLTTNRLVTNSQWLRDGGCGSLYRILKRDGLKLN